MTPDGMWGVRLARVWVTAYTATAPPTDSANRRAEIDADLADELSASAGAPAGRLSRQIASRVLRGMAADVLWRLSVERVSGRAAWHLAHPTTVLGALCVLMAPLVVAVDLLRPPEAGAVGPALRIVHTAVVLLSSAVVATAVAAVAYRLVHRRDVEPGPRRTPLRLLRRWAALAACVAWAVSALWRFAGAPLASVAAVAWGAFGVALLTWWACVVALGVARLGRRLFTARVTLDHEKVSS